MFAGTLAESVPAPAVKESGDVTLLHLDRLGSQPDQADLLNRRGIRRGDLEGRAVADAAGRTSDLGTRSRARRSRPS